LLARRCCRSNEVVGAPPANFNRRGGGPSFIQSFLLRLDLTTSHRQTWLFGSTSTYHSTDLLTACGVAHLVVHETSGSTSYEAIPHVRLETSGDVLSTVDMVVQRRDGPSWLRELDDDDDNDSCCVPCERGASIVSPSLDRKYKRRLYKLLKDGTETKN